MTRTRENCNFFFSHATLAYVLLLICVTLWPLSDWIDAIDNPWTLLLTERAQSPPKSDIIVNILMYIPLGMLLAHVFLHHGRLWASLLLAGSLAALLSIALELLQAYNPPRVPSLWDIVFNITGALIGATLALGFWQRAERLHAWLRRVNKKQH